MYTNDSSLMTALGAMVVGTIDFSGKKKFLDSFSTTFCKCQFLCTKFVFVQVRNLLPYRILQTKFDQKLVQYSQRRCWKCEKFINAQRITTDNMFTIIGDT